MLSFTDTQLFEWITVLVMPLFRILGLMTSAPVLSNRAMSGRIRLAMGLSVSLIVSMVIEVPAGVSLAGLAGPDAWLLVARELGIGLLIGFVARLIFAAFELAGELIGLQMGLSFAGFFDPSAGHANAVGRFLNNFAMLTFVAMNGPLVLLVAVVQSFQVFPIATAGFDWSRFDLVALAAGLFVTGLSMALPFMMLLLFMNCVLGVISRVAPQLNVFAIGFPITIGCALGLLAVAFPIFERPLERAMQQLMTALL